jgi:transcriptional regulator with XRE-family HTH domain
MTVGDRERWSDRPGDGAFAEALARAVRVLRTELGMSRKELADRAGLSYSYVSEIENAAKQPSSRALRAVAQAFGLEAHELLAAAEARMGEAPAPEEAEEAEAPEVEAEALRTTLRAAGHAVWERGRPGRWFHGKPDRPAQRALREAEPSFLRLEIPPPAAPEPEGEADDLEATLEELRRLLAALSPQDRERVLDLAKRLRTP